MKNSMMMKNKKKGRNLFGAWLSLYQESLEGGRGAEREESRETGQNLSRNPKMKNRPLGRPKSNEASIQGVRYVI